MRHGRRHARTTALLRRPTTIAAGVAATTVIVVAAALAITPAQAGQRRAPAKAAGPNLAVNRQVTGSAACRADEAAAKAVNGSVSGGNSDKWCSASGSKTLQVDLGSATTIGSVVVRHAQAGGERASFNTRSFDIAVSTDGTSFSTVAEVRNNTAAFTDRAVTPVAARYVRLSVLQAEQGTGKVARIYELEVYGAPKPVPSPSTSAAPSPSVPPSTSPKPSPTAGPPPPPKPPTNPANCFPYPAYDASRGPHTTVTVQAGAKVDPKQLAALKTMFEKEWPAAWQTLATDRELAKGDKAGVSHVIITAGGSGLFDNGTHYLPDKDIPEWFNDGFEGHFIHEASHMLGPTYPDKPPNFYLEGLTDFSRYVMHGRDRVWNATDLESGFGDALDRKEVWDFGYALAARFLLWLTQKFDTSGNRYEKVAELIDRINHFDPKKDDYLGVFEQVWGEKFGALFDEYQDHPAIWEHC